MALTKIPRGLLDTGIADSSDATAITIDSSENATFAGDVLVNKFLRLRTTDDQTNQWYLYTHTDDTFRINYNGAGNDEIVVDTTGKVGIGEVSPANPLSISYAIHGLYSQHRPSHGVGVGQEMYYKFNTANSTPEIFGSIYTEIEDNTDGAESGKIALRAAKAGTLTTGLMLVGSTGNVGIGTTGPNAKLSLGNTTGAKKLLVYDGSTGNNLYAGFAIDSPAANDFTMYAHNTGVLKFGKMSTDASTITPHMTILNDGNVGIGDTSPFAKLHVEDTSWSSGSPYGAVAYIQGGAVNDLNWGHLLVSQSGTTTDTGGRISLGANGENPIAGLRAKYKGATYGDLAFLTRPSGGTNTERMVITSTGVTQFFTGDGTSNIAEFHTNASSGSVSGYISFAPQGTTRAYIGTGSSLLSGAAVSEFIIRSEGDLIFNSNGNNERMRISSDGHVGIGRDPDVTLEVDGPLKITNNTAGGISQTHTNMTVANSGKLLINFGSIGTMTTGDTIVFTYAATSWKSWFFKIRWSSTGGYMGELWAGGYNNNSDGYQILNPRYYAAGSGDGSSNTTVEGATLTVTRSGQGNTMTLTLNNSHIHPLFEIEYACGGGEGIPNASKATLTVNS